MHLNTIIQANGKLIISELQADILQTKRLREKLY